MDPMDVPPLPTPDSALKVGSPPAETPRRSHLRQLSLASTPIQPRSSPSGSGTPSGTPRSSPLPSPLNRPGSVGRRSGRQSSISYSPSIRSVVAPDADGASGRASPRGGGGFPPRSSSDGTSLDLELGRSSGEYGTRVPLGDRNGRSLAHSIPEKAEDDEASSATGRARSRSSLSIGSAGSMHDREALATPKEPLTLVEQYASLLSSIARKESIILEIRNTLGTHEKELAELKAQWRELAATNAAPGVSHPQPTVIEAAEGLLGTDTVQSGKRLLNLVLGVGGEEHEGAPNGSSTPSPAAPVKIRKSLSGRSSTDLRRSLSGLEQVNEAPEDAPSAEGSLSTSERPLEDALPSTSPPASRSTPGRPTHPRATAGKRLSLLSSTSSISSQSSVDTAPWLHSDANTARVAEEEAEEAADGKEVKGLMSDLAGSSGGGWGRKFGDLAAGLHSNEHFLQSKRASMSFASSLTSSWTSFNTLSPLTLPPLSSNAPPPKSPSPQPRTSPSPSPSSVSTPRKVQATKMRPISSAGASRQLTSPRSASFPTGPTAATGADFFSELDESPAKLQAPLAPSGNMPAPRLSSPTSSPGRQAAAPVDSGDGDDWNW